MTKIRAFLRALSALLDNPRPARRCAVPGCDRFVSRKNDRICDRCWMETSEA